MCLVTSDWREEVVSYKALEGFQKSWHIPRSGGTYGLVLRSVFLKINCVPPEAAPDVLAENVDSWAWAWVS